MIGSTISHYRIVEKLGEAGMGIVYKAEDSRLKSPVALKFLPRDVTADPEARERFIHEARAARALDHPNICTIYEIGETEHGPEGPGQLFISMAYYEGETLAKKIARGPLDVKEAVEIGIQISQGLSKAHQSGIIHRDIKPQNIIVTGDGVVKILDFGIARFSGQTRLTKFGSIVGTVIYMSPEQARGEEVDQRTDIWSLGVMMYEMMTGKLPFPGEYEQAILYQILHDDPVPILKVRPEVPLKLVGIAGRAMQRNARNRYQRIQDMITDLKKIATELETSTLKLHPIRAMIYRVKRSHLYVGGIGLAVLVAAISLFLFPRHSYGIDLAVLPFVNESADTTLEYFSDGVAESIIDNLSRLPNVRVTAFSSVIGYKHRLIDPQAVSKDLNGVRAVLMSRVLSRGDEISIKTELVDTHDKSQIWGDHYNRKLADIFSVQEEIANNILQNLRVRLTGEERQKLTRRYTENTEAYQFYLKGRYEINCTGPNGSSKGVEFFQKAIEIDPSYASAYVGLAEAYLLVSGELMPAREAVPKIRAAATKALEIDSSLGEAHGPLGYVKVFSDWKFADGESEFRKAIELNPGYAWSYMEYAYALLAMGRFEEAIKQNRLAYQRDPLSNLLGQQLALSYFHLGRSDLALEQLQVTPWVWLSGLIDEQKGFYDKAVSHYLAGSEFWSSPADTVELRRAFSHSGWNGFVLKSIELYLEKEGYHYPWTLSVLYARAGDNDKAFEYLNKGIEEGDDHLPWVKVDPRFKNLRSDTRYGVFLRKLGME